MSHHLDTPLAAQTGQLYLDDLYVFPFSEPDDGGRQALRLHELTGQAARDDSAAGRLVLEGRTGQTATADGTRIWAGRIADSFYIDLSLRPTR